MSRHRTSLFVAAVVAVLLVAELGLRAVEDRLPDALDWYAAQPQQLIAQMDRVREMELRSDIVLVGSSMVAEGIDVPALERGLDSGTRVHNVALDGAQPSVVERWLSEEVEPRLQPDRVIWGVSSRSFNPNRPKRTIENYERSRAIRSGFFGTADRLLASVSMISRHRSFLRLETGFRALFTKADTFGALANATPAEELLSPLLVDGQNRTAEELAHVKRAALDSWALGDSEEAAFLNTIARLQSSGIEIAIVLMPVPSEYVEAHPDGLDDYDAFQARVQALGREHGFAVLDFGRAYPNDAFKDYTHLRPTGAEQFTADLAESLAELGW